jgi:hypothetical protein
MIRALLAVGCLVVLLMAIWGLRVGWRHRYERQSYLPEPPTAPADLGAPVLEPSSGDYIGTTFAASWQDRVVIGGLGSRASASMTPYAAGVLVAREGADPVFVPTSSIVEARLTPGLAGKVVGAGGLLVIRWRLGDVEVDTGFRADDKSDYPLWVRTINQQAVEGVPGSAPNGRSSRRRTAT